MKELLLTIKMNKLREFALKLGKNGRNASSKMHLIRPSQKNDILRRISDCIETNKENIFKGNALDLKIAKKARKDSAFVDRLEITDQSIHDMCDGLEQVASLPDPIGAISNLQEQPSGIKVGTMNVPIGVILMIYESRPNVTVDAAALTLKTGNAIILRGGSESINSNVVLHTIFHDTLKSYNFPTHCVQLAKETNRDLVKELLLLDKYIDIVIPRGGKSLIERISKDSKIQIIKHLDGICHVYIDEFADKKRAVDITMNSKTQRLGTCNTLETLLVNRKIAGKVLPLICMLLLEKDVEIRVCKLTKTILSEKKFPELKKIKVATNKDWATEYLDAILSIKTVACMDEAISHIATYGSSHTDSIVTENHENAMNFLRRVDSSSVMVNTSTRFADGFQYGLGAEIGISTNKLHARGPVGLEGLTTKKWIVMSDGQVRR
ncbi:glutamate-5-semialdehyde dehydrogenase [Betaproteobacteria bacterium]|nr:glutamate-5-semialdehyde dehydrogenase [Betaproteobacteria bacterium]